MPAGIAFLLYGASVLCFLYMAYTLIKAWRGTGNPVEVGLGLLVGYMGLVIFTGTFLEHATDMPYQQVSQIKNIMFLPLLVVFLLGFFVIGKALRRGAGEDDTAHAEKDEEH